MIIDSVGFARFRQPRSIYMSCQKCQTKVEPECQRDYFWTAKCFWSSSHMELLCGICRDRGR
jgi:hypothetical protein